MNRSVTLLGAAVVGFVGVVTLHGPSGQKVSQTRVGAPTTSSPNTSAPPGSGPATTVGGSINGSAVGQKENYGYGQMSVKVTIANNRIVDVSVNSIQALESYSLQLEQQVVPILKSEVLQAQSTRISALSGATYTSEAYAYSLQSALDRLHFK